MQYGKEWKAGVALGALIGAVSGWLFATYPGWVDAWGREHWWNIATAFGTVGATVAAVLVPFLSRRKDQRKALVESLRTDSVSSYAALQQVDYCILMISDLFNAGAIPRQEQVDYVLNALVVAASTAHSDELRVFFSHVQPAVNRFQNNLSDRGYGKFGTINPRDTWVILAGREFDELRKSLLFFRSYLIGERKRTGTLRADLHFEPEFPW